MRTHVLVESNQSAIMLSKLLVGARGRTDRNSSGWAVVLLVLGGPDTTGGARRASCAVA